MTNYIDTLYTLSDFKRDNPALAKQAERAKDYLKGYCNTDEETTFIVIEVEGCKCVAYLVDEFSPYVVCEMIAPFDEERIYPLQGLATHFAFKRY